MARAGTGEIQWIQGLCFGAWRGKLMPQPLHSPLGLLLGAKALDLSLFLTWLYHSTHP